jgi:hypothetical protein
MSRYIGWRRALRDIEADLAASAPELSRLFTTFTLLTQDVELPRTERLRPGPARMITWLRRQASRALAFGPAGATPPIGTGPLFWRA